jgi:hypothetical protein
MYLSFAKNMKMEAGLGACFFYGVSLTKNMAFGFDAEHSFPYPY